MQVINLYVICLAALLPWATHASVWEAAVSAPLTPATVPTPCMSPSRPLPTPELAAPTAESSPDALRLQARVEDSEPAPPAITPALGQVGADPAQLAARFRQTTYTSCVTHGTYVHCGVHEPILDAGGSSLGGQPLSTTVARAILVAAVLGVHLVWA